MTSHEIRIFFEFVEMRRFKIIALLQHERFEDTLLLEDLYRDIPENNTAGEQDDSDASDWGNTARGIKNHQNKGRIDSEKLGRRLFSALFSGALRPLLENTSNHPILNFHFDPRLPFVQQLIAIHWELIHNGQIFIGAGTLGGIVRKTPSSGRPGQRDIGRGFRLLIIISGTSDLACWKEAEQITALFGDQRDHRSKVLLNPDLLEIRNELFQNGPYDILHFIGHGDWDETIGVGCLLFHENKTRINIITDQELIQIIADTQSLKLVFLNICTGTAGNVNRELFKFNGLSFRLVSGGIPAVLGYPCQIDDHLARTFATSFYEKLLETGDLLHAVGEARVRLFAQKAHRNGFFLPTLYFGYPQVFDYGPSIYKRVRQRNDCIHNHLGMSFAPIPPGLVTLGTHSPFAAYDEKPVTQVEITKPFYLARWPVTQWEWWMVMGGSPPDEPELPRTEISWGKAHEFLKKLHVLTPNYAYRLPSEAEWEHACLAGFEGDFGFDGELSILEEYAFFNQGHEPSLNCRVALKRENRWGLHDMHGLVWEWCEDIFEVYDAMPQRDRKRLGFAPTKVARGGCFLETGWNCRASIRKKQAASRPGKTIGFRPVLTLKGDS